MILLAFRISHSLNTKGHAGSEKNTQQFQEFLTKMNTKQRQSIDQILGELAETAGLSDTYT